MLQFDYNYSLSQLGNIASLIEKLTPLQEKLSRAQDPLNNSPYSFINLPEDQALHERISQIVISKKALNISTLVLIGIGGSALGTLAVLEALYGREYNLNGTQPKFYCADTLDGDKLFVLLKQIEIDFQAQKKVLVIIVTKSGTTTETLVNASFFYNLLKKYQPTTYKNYIIAVTDKDSSLWDIAQKEQWTTVEIPSYIGGRYSVLTAAALLPLAFLDISTSELSKGAAFAVSQAINLTADNHAAVNAAIIYSYMQQKINIHDIFLFSVDYLALGAWYRQLIGESLGKDGKGITPTISLGTLDLHSVVQLYLAGPRDKFTTFVRTKSEHEFIIEDSMFDKNKLFVGKTVSDIVNATFDGVVASYQYQDRPYCIINLKEKSAFSVGQFMYHKMLETVYLAHLLEVNAFDQPQVELYKKETKKRLL